MAPGWDEVTVLRKRNVPTKKTAGAGNANNSSTTLSSSTGSGFKKGAQINRNKDVIDPRHAIKIDNETEEFKIKTIGPSVGRAIQKARAEKGLSQKELASLINERVSIVVECEAGKQPISDAQPILSKMEKVLLIQLRGKNIGAPLEQSHSVQKKHGATATKSKTSSGK